MLGPLLSLNALILEGEHTKIAKRNGGRFKCPELRHVHYEGLISARALDLDRRDREEIEEKGKGFLRLRMIVMNSAELCGGKA